MREAKADSSVQEAEGTSSQKFEILKYANQFRSHKSNYFPWADSWFRTYSKNYWINWLLLWFVTWKRWHIFWIVVLILSTLIMLKVIHKDKESNFISINISSEEPKIHTFYYYFKAFCWVCFINSTFVQSSVQWVFQG